MKHRNLIFSVLVVLGLFFAVQWAGADNSDRYARIRHIEGDVAIYPNDGDRPSDATINSPVLDGDELETQNGRAEVSFHNGIVIRLGDYSAIRFDSVYSPMTIELLQGTVFVDSHTVSRFRDELEVRAGDAQVYLINEGNLRVDLGKEGTVRVTTLDGEAEVRASGDRVLLEKEQRTYVDPGNSPERAETFAKNYDELDDWNQGRIDVYADMGNSRDNGYVQDSLYYDTYDLNSYGDWRTYGSYGNVWVPRVSVGWRPYYDGRWLYTNSSYFWVSYEPWGWAPYHYGRWDWAPQFGWYWIPGYSFAPSWVSWYDYGDYIGWCPLNYYNYPVYYYNPGQYYPPIQKQKTLGVGDSWTFVKKGALGDPSIKRISTSASSIKDLRIDKGRVQLQPGKSLTPYVAGKGTQKAGSVAFQKPASSKQESWDTQRNGGSSKGGWNDRESVRDPIRKPSDTGSSKSTGSSPRTIQPSTKGNSGNSGSSVNKGGGSSSSIKKTPSGGSGSTNKKPTPPNFSRDEQFDRSTQPGFYSGSKLSRDSDSQTIRERQFDSWGSSRQDAEPRNFDNYKSLRDNGRAGDDTTPWYRDPRSYDEPNRNDDSREVSPRYLEGAKKVFEGYQSSRSNPDNTRDYGNSGSRDSSRDTGRYGSSSSGGHVESRSNSGSSNKSFSGGGGNRNSGGSVKAAPKSSSGSSTKKPH